MEYNFQEMLARGKRYAKEKNLSEEKPPERPVIERHEEDIPEPYEEPGLDDYIPEYIPEDQDRPFEEPEDMLEGLEDPEPERVPETTITHINTGDIRTNEELAALRRSISGGSEARVEAFETEDKAAVRRVSEAFIDVCDALEDFLTETEPKKVRKYTKSDPKLKINYKAAKKGKNESLKPFIIGMCIVAVVAGVILGIEANSYYAAYGGDKGIMCLIKAFTITNNKLVLTPFDAEVFISSFVWGFVIVAVIGLLVLSNKAEERRSRLGHEHGKTRLANSSDINKYINEMMEG